MSANILIVEDDDATCQAIQTVLGERGHNVLIAPNGAAALRIIPHYPPQLILLAAHMQGLDGLAFLRGYSQLPKQGAPIIVMSSKDDTLTRALTLYSHGFLEKPIQQDKLRALVNRYLH